MKTSVRALAVLAVLTSTLWAGALAVQAATPLPDPAKATFGVQPSQASGPDQRPFLLYTATKGASFDDHVAVRNYSLQALTLNVYATDAINTPDGGFGLLPASSKAVDAGSWIHPTGASTAVTVAPQSFRIVPIHIAIPSDASPGDHVAGVIASLSTATSNPHAPNVKLDQRVATRVYVRVAGPIHPGLQIENVRTAYHDDVSPLSGGSAKVSFTVHNVGNVKLGGRTKVTVHGLLGTSTAVSLPDFPLLLPGNTLRLSTNVSGIYPEMLEHATVTISPLLLPGDTDPGLKKYSSGDHFLAIPWLPLAAILLMGVAGAHLWRRRHRVFRLSRVRAAAPSRSKERVS